MTDLLQYGFTVFGERVSYAEFFGQLCALLVVFLAQRRSRLTWSVQVGATVLLFVVYLSAHLGGLAARQIAIMLISIWGYWVWTRRKHPIHGLPVRWATNRERLALLAGMLAGWVVMALTLQALDASWAPWPDAWIFVGTLAAFTAQAIGLVEFWLIWLAVDAVGVPLQYASGLHFSATVYVVFVLLVLHGLVSWNRSAKLDRERLVSVGQP